MDEGWDTCNESGDGLEENIRLVWAWKMKNCFANIWVFLLISYAGKLLYAREFLLVDDLFILLKKGNC